MNEDVSISPALPLQKRRWNWWKVGFFAMLILFEIAREFAVLAGAEGAQPAALKTIYGDADYVAAQGRWLRSDGGSPIEPGAVTIQCRRETGQCVEASVVAHADNFMAPEVDWFSAKFSQDGVSYVNDDPVCARYSVRIDLVQKRAFATRELKDGPKNEVCSKLEPRIAMELRDGFISDPAPFAGHFVPLVQLIFGTLRSINGV